MTCKVSFFLSTSLIEVLFRSEEARMDALQAGIYPMDFVQRYFASFYCVACTLMGNRQIIYTVRDGVKTEISGVLPELELMLGT